MEPHARTSDGKPVMFHDLKREQFPFRVRALDIETDEVLWIKVVYGPGALEIPGFAPRVVKIEMTFTNGMQHIEGPGISETKQIIPVPRF